MERKHFTYLVAVAAVFGLIGGAASDRILLGTPAGATGGKTPVKSLVVNELAVVGKDGEPIALIGEVEGVAGLGIFGRDKEPRILLGSPPDGVAGISITGPGLLTLRGPGLGTEQETRVTLGMDEEGYAFLQFLNRGKERGLIRIDNGSSNFLLRDNTESSGAHLWAKKTFSGLVLSDRQKKTRASLAVVLDKGGLLTFHDESGEPVWKAP